MYCAMSDESVQKIQCVFLVLFISLTLYIIIIYINLRKRVNMKIKSDIFNQVISLN